MARVKLCSACEHRNPLDEMFCQNCGASLANAAAVDDGETFPVSAQATDVQTPISTGCPPPAVTTRENYVLVFDWGEVPISNRLAIGRDVTFSPVAQYLQPFDTVSRLHAEIVVERGSAFVRHLGRNNPTFVNGRALDTGETSSLNDGDRIGFSRAVSARFKSL